MLARIGIQATLNAQTKGLHFDKIGRTKDNNTSFFMLGWTPGSYDGLNALDLPGLDLAKVSGSEQPFKELLGRQLVGRFTL